MSGDERARLFRELRARTDLRLSLFDDLGLIGRGSFGEVRKVRLRTAPRALFALKSPPRAEPENAAARAQLANERDIIARLRHPFIAELCTHFDDAGETYLLLEYVAGGELFARLQSQLRFNEDVTLFYSSEILLALRYLHLNDIAYRDLKFENVLLDADGHVKLVDFGSAKAIGGGRTSTLCGTQAYLSPEMLVGGAEGYGKASDWWTFGVVVFEMSVGAHPFYDKDPFEMYRKIVTIDYTLPRFLSPALRALLRQLLTAEPRRLGAADDGLAVMAHEFFQAVRFEEIVARRTPVPWLPAAETSNDVFAEF